MLGFHRCPWVLPLAVVPAPVPMPCDWPLEGKKQDCMGELMETQTMLFIGNTGGIGRQLQPQGHQLCLCVCKCLFYHRWLNKSAGGCMGWCWVLYEPRDKMLQRLPLSDKVWPMRPRKKTVGFLCFVSCSYFPFYVLLNSQYVTSFFFCLLPGYQMWRILTAALSCPCPGSTWPHAVVTQSVVFPFEGRAGWYSQYALAQTLLV